MATAWHSCEVAVGGLAIELERRAIASLVRGRVVDRAGAAVSGARLALVAAAASRSSVEVVDGELWLWKEALLADGHAADPGEGRARSEADGAFAIASERSGQARMVAYAADHALAWSEPFELVSGTELDVGTLVLSGGARLQGQIVVSQDPRDRIQPRCVAIEPFDGSPISVKLDDGHEFAVEGLEPGAYRVSVEAEVPVSFREDQREQIPVSTEHVHLEPFESKHLVLGCGATLAGVTVRGRLSVPDERLTRGGLVLIGDDGEPRRLAILREDLSFVVPDVPAGRFSLAAIGEDPGGSVAGAACIELVIEAGSTPAGVSLSLDGPRLELQAPGYPSTFAWIEAQTGSAALDRFLGRNPIRTDERGRFEFVALPRGTYGIRIDGTTKTAVVSEDAPPQVLAW
jgi:hypothetical protein